MAGGYIKLDRRVLQSAVADDMELLGRWVWILASVNWKTRQLLNGITLKPGQMLTSMDRLALAWKCSKTSAFRGTQKMKKLNMIVTESGTLGTVITVCNWGTYQREDKSSGTKVERERNESGTRRGTKVEQEEEGKKGRRKEGQKGNSSRAAYRHAPGDFELASWMLSRLQEINPNHKLPNLARWANDIRLMREIDGKTLDEIEQLFAWANHDDFWQANIASSPSSFERRTALPSSASNGINS